MNYQPANSIVAYESGSRRGLDRAEQLEEVDEMAEVVAALNLDRTRIDRTIRTQRPDYTNERANHQRTMTSLNLSAGTDMNRSAAYNPVADEVGGRGQHLDRTNRAKKGVRTPLPRACSTSTDKASIVLS